MTRRYVADHNATTVERDRREHSGHISTGRLRIDHRPVGPQTPLTRRRFHEHLIFRIHGPSTHRRGARDHTQVSHGGSDRRRRGAPDTDARLGPLAQLRLGTAPEPPGSGDRGRPDTRRAGARLASRRMRLADAPSPGLSETNPLS